MGLIQKGNVVLIVNRNGNASVDVYDSTGAMMNHMVQSTASWCDSKTGRMVSWGSKEHLEALVGLLDALSGTVQRVRAELGVAAGETVRP